MYYRIKALFIALFWFLPDVSYAIPAPDLISNILTQAIQIFGLLFALIASFATGILIRIRRLAASTWIFIGILCLGLFVSAGAAIWYVKNKSHQPSISIHTPQTTSTLNVATSSAVGLTEQESYLLYKQREAALIESYKRELEESQDALAAELGIATTTIPADDVSRFVNAYYQLIDEKRMSRAIAVTGATKSERELIRWYQDVYHVYVFSLKPVDENNNRRSVLVGLRYKDSIELYDVVQEVLLEKGKPVKLKLISSVLREKRKTKQVLSSAPLAISNEAFQAWREAKKDMTILDAREDLEYGYGHMPGSLHVRQADVIAKGSHYIELSKPVVVYCYTGGRGSEIAYALRKQGFEAYALIDGVQGWVEDYHGDWLGKHRFWDAYPQFGKIQFTRDFERIATRPRLYVIDASDTAHPKLTNMKSDMSFYLFETVSFDVEEYLKQVPKDRPIAAVCQEYVDCFAAKIIAQTLVNRGYTVLGAYDMRDEL